MLELTCKTPLETESAGEALGRTLERGDVVALLGGLGAGKTAFARGVGRGLGVSGGVCSPTFTISMEHEGSAIPFVHMDAYRLTGSDEFLELGLDEAFGRAATLIEWADIIEDALPEKRIEITIRPCEDGQTRVISVSALGGANPKALFALGSFK